MTAAELRGIDRIVIAASGTSWHAALVGEYLIEELAQIAGRGRVRARILLPQLAAGKRHRAARDLAVRRNGGHAGGVARSQAARPPRAGHRQRRRQHHRARIRRRHLHARRAGNRRRLDQGVRVNHRDFDAAGDSSGPDAPCSPPSVRWRFCTRWKPCPKQIESILAQNNSLKKIAKKYAKADDFFFLGRGYTFPSRSKARSS